jgi:hypothetical protein
MPGKATIPLEMIDVYYRKVPEYVHALEELIWVIANVFQHTRGMCS